MLAFKTKPSKLAYPVFIQPKYNGVRALYLPEHKTLQSREEILWEPSVVEHLLSHLTSLNFVTDGELYKHGMSLQQINSRIAVKRIKPHDKGCEIGYIIYDVPTSQPMYKRVEILTKLDAYIKDKDWKHVSVAETHLVSSQLEADYYYKQWKDQGYEGLMYRTYEAPYGFAQHCGNQDNRWWSLQKRKDFLDLFATITGVYEGKDGFKNLLGGFHCISDDGVEFDVGGGLDLEQRNRYWEEPRIVIGSRIRVNYEMFSDGGQPLKATIESVDENFS